MKLVGNSKNFVDVKIFEGKLFADNRGQFSKPFYGDILDDEFGGIVKQCIQNQLRIQFEVFTFNYLLMMYINLYTAWMEK